ncbi:MAG: protein kinase [Candidatus Obscuribacterales bacterium]|nr:protein kinase [Candidatus Obscuribacterales bacterium]
MFIAPGTVIDQRFTILNSIGAGGMATVYRAEQHGLERLVAIKIMQESLEGDASQQARFLREATVLSRLSHPGIVKFFHFGMHDGRYPYLVMELCEGLTLNSLKDEQGRIHWKRCFRLLKQAAEILSYAHAQGVLHRDLSPQNILVEKREGNESVKLIDFGLASFKSAQVETLTATGALIGSVRYMSPEQSKGQKALPASDVYSLACITYEMLSGRCPFEADTAMGLIYLHANAEAPQLKLKESDMSAELLEALDTLLSACLSKNPDDRPTAKELAGALSLLEEEKIAELESEPYWQKQKTKKQKKGRETIPYTVGIICFIAFIAAFSFVQPVQKDPLALPDKHNKISPARIKSMSLKELAELLAGDSKHELAQSEIISKWKSSHVLRPEQLRDFAGEARSVSITFQNHVEQSLLAAELGLEAANKTQIEFSEVETLLMQKSQALVEKKDAKALQQMIEELKAENFSKHTNFNPASFDALLLLFKISEASLRNEDAKYRLLILEYFKRFSNSRIDSKIDSTFWQEASKPLLSSPAKSPFLEQLATLSSNWLRSKNRGPKFLKESFPSISKIITARAADSPEIAQIFWKTLSPEEQKQLEHSPPYEIQSLEWLFSMQNEFERAIQLCLRKARFLEEQGKGNDALELLREAIHWQLSCPKRLLTKGDFDAVERLYVSSKGRHEKNWAEALESTVCEERQLGESSAAKSLIQKLRESAFTDKLTAEELSNLDAVLQRLEAPAKH